MCSTKTLNMDAWTATERLQEAGNSVCSRSHENGISLVIMVTCDVIFASALNVTISPLQWHTSCKNEIYHMTSHLGVK